MTFCNFYLDCTNNVLLTHPESNNNVLIKCPHLHLGPKIWESIPSKIGEKDSSKKFKDEIKQWKPNSCSCKLCKRYIQQVGYIQSSYIYVIIYYLHHHISPVFKNILYIEHAA